MNTQKIKDLNEKLEMLNDELIESLENRYHLEDQLTEENKNIELIKEKKKKIREQLKKYNDFY